MFLPYDDDTFGRVNDTEAMCITSFGSVLICMYPVVVFKRVIDWVFAEVADMECTPASGFDDLHSGYSSKMTSRPGGMGFGFGLHRLACGVW